ncbi:MAG: hypothetical protein AAFP96_06215, partial [Bacteroidota bacterium]
NAEIAEDFNNAGNTNPRRPKQMGFLECAECISENVRAMDPDGIGGFMVTAANGMTYHFALPVYQFEEFYPQDENEEDYFVPFQVDKYATHWLLTAITGPDFIDQGTIGVLDDADLGFWVGMNYGKWSDGYIWRTPFEGRSNKQSALKPSYSMGRKQIYYLDQIFTATHTAYFVKGLREDGKGAGVSVNDFDLELASTLKYKEVPSPPLDHSGSY